MISLLAVTCYLPNASFVYNPITHRGQLVATYIPDDDGTAYEICSKLNQRLARASIELANDEEVFSANFEFRHGVNVDIEIEFITTEQQESGLLTAQSNFKISMLDMDAEVKQTLAFFSVQSYNANDCLSNIQNNIVGNTMVVTADQAGCNYDITKFGKKTTGLTPEQLNQTVIATIYCFELQVTMPVGIQFSALSPADSFELIFDCDAQPNSSTCLSIIRNFTFQPMKTSNFELKFQVQNPETDYLILQSKFAAISDPAYTSCYSSIQYQVNGELAIFYFTPSGNCEFDTAENQMTIGMADSLNYKIAKSWVFVQQNFSFDSGTAKFSLECRELEIDDCSEMLSYLGQLEQLYVTLTFVFYEGGEQHFFSTFPSRYQQCFEYLEVTARYANGDVTGSIEVDNVILSLPGCTLVNPNRILIQLECYKKTVPGGSIIEIEELPFLVLNEREIFSISNITVVFERISNVSLFAEMASLIITNSLYCQVQYDDLILPIIKYTDLTNIFSNQVIYLISIIGGILGGLIYAGIDVLVTIRQYKAKNQ